MTKASAGRVAKRGSGGKWQDQIVANSGRVAEASSGGVAEASSGRSGRSE